MVAYKRAMCFLFALAAASLAAGAVAENYPDKPVRIVAPFQAGGAGDVAARALADALSKRLGQPVVVENKPGANGILGARLAATAAADGYTLLMGHTDVVVLNPLTHTKLPYDATGAFEPVAYVSRIAGVLIARPGAGVASGSDLIRAAKASPGKVSLASWGIGSSVHLGMLMMEQAAGIDLLHVPHQGTPAAVASVLGGHSDLVFVTAEFAQAAAKSGKATIVGASSATRIAAAPDVKTLAEQGFAGFDMDTWYGLMAPRGTSQSIREKLHYAVNAALDDPEIGLALRKAGHELGPMTMGEFGALVSRDQARWARILAAKKLSISLD